MAQKIDNLSALDWDDSALIRAYNKGMSLRGKDLEKESYTANKNYKKSSKKKSGWKVGDYCCAEYYGDNLWYEAQITAIDGDMCTVEFLGYDEEDKIALSSLDKSSGKKAIKLQKKIARNAMNWKVGDHCCAEYYGDNLWYEAQITAIDGDMCTVEFLGYDEEVEIALSSLDKSFGKKAIKHQKKIARKNAMNDFVVDDSADGDDTKNDSSIIHSPLRHHHHHHHHSKKGCRRNQENHTFDQTNNFTANDSTFHNAYPVMRYTEMSTTVPPVPVPPCSEVIQNPAMSTMLTAWYMAGYYTGLHEAQKNASQQHYYSSQAHNYHQ